MLRQGKHTLVISFLSLLAYFMLIAFQPAQAASIKVTQKNAAVNKTSKYVTLSIATIAPHQTITFNNSPITSSLITTNLSTVPSSCPQTQSSAVHPNNGCTYFDCWDADVTNTSIIDSNKVDFRGNIYNDCSFTLYNVAVTFLFETINCRGTSSAPANSYIYPPSVGSYSSISYDSGNDTGYCETCQNGRAVDWPPFDISFEIAKVIGYDSTSVSTRNGYERTALAPITAHMTNSYRYSFPCP